MFSPSFSTAQSSAPNSGAFAYEIAWRMVDWFVSTDQEIVAPTLIEQLRAIRVELEQKFRGDSASYLLVHAVDGQDALVLHAGDCLIGHHAFADRISWLVQPHTLANALSQIAIDDLARDRSRHRLTRSFRSREFVEPASCSIPSEETTLLAVTDGFWAELGHIEQGAFIRGDIPESTGERDDRSALQIMRISGEGLTTVSGIERASSIYVRRAEERSR